MTENNHPITPPPELIEDWIEIAKPLPQRPPNPNELAALAARWGADQELEACRLWVSENCDIYSAVELIQSRRPKPPSLKEQALKALLKIGRIDSALYSVIRDALESLPD
jgi:hypothetical protein